MFIRRLLGVICWVRGMAYHRKFGSYYDEDVHAHQKEFVEQKCGYVMGIPSHGDVYRCKVCGNTHTLWSAN